MAEKKQRRRLSLITDFVIFCIFSVVTVVIVRCLGLTESLDNYPEEQSTLSLLDTKENIADQNKLYIQKIKKEYGIIVKYGEEVKNYTDKVGANMQNDIYILNNNLMNLYQALEKYPYQVYEIFMKEKYPMYILIVDSFNNDNIALASRNRLNEFRIYISNDERFERAFHHEMYHVLEYYMQIKNANIYFSWKDLNPDQFKYENDTSKLTKKYVYDKNSYVPFDTYFVTKYSKANEKEDRAEIFAELMIMNKKLEYLENDCNVRDKVDSIFDAISENITEYRFSCQRYLD